MLTTLCPAQQQEYNRLISCLGMGNLFVIFGDTGMGKTTLLHAIHRHVGGVFLNMRDFMHAMRNKHPLALEETFEQMLLDALTEHDTVVLDDLHLLADVTAGGCSFYPRSNLLNAPLTTLCAHATASGKKLIFGNQGSAPGPVRERCVYAGVRELTVADYAFFCHAYLDAESAESLDFAKIFRFAPKLHGHQLKSACAWHRTASKVTTESFIDYLRSQRMASNVDLGEVQAVDLHDLKGVDDVIQALEANIILPLENDALATELDIKPKRGVLLVGPPGTGKTTVGRALAHRLKSKFLLIDGTFISGSRDFYQKIGQVFEQAKQNAPSIIFIDDSDVIFENGEELGLYRYLLTMLDGLESESAGRICVIMTAMDVSSLPPALIRSGRIELWLETRPPDGTARLAILEQRVAELPFVLRAVDIPRLVEATEGLTGADLKRLMEDGKILFAYERSKELPLRPATDYFLSAVEVVRANKARYAEAEQHARQQRPQRPSFFDIMRGMEAAAGLEAGIDACEA